VTQGKEDLLMQAAASGTTFQHQPTSTNSEQRTTAINRIKTIGQLRESGQ
jgi:hypothetical protein